MKPWLSVVLGALVLVLSAAAAACPICFRGMGLTTAQQLASAKRAVLAGVTADGEGLQITAIIKGNGTAGERIEAADLIDAAYLRAAGTSLMLQGPFSPMWLNAGSVADGYTEWLQRIAQTTPDSSADNARWSEHVAFLLPYLDSSEPMLAAIAYSELARAPYFALRTLRPRLNSAELARWLDDPARQRLYTLLFGIAGGKQDAEALEQRLEAAWQAKSANNLAAMLAADLELRGPARVAWIESRYLTDRGRTLPEIEAALTALSVQGTADAAVPRARVIAAQRRFIQAHKPMAGLVASDLAAWSYWDAGPQYLALLESGVLQDPASRYAVIAYLKQSPRADVKAALRSLAEAASVAR